MQANLQDFVWFAGTLVTVQAVIFLAVYLALRSR